MVDPNLFSWSKFSQIPVIGILRGLPQKEIIQLASVYQKNEFTTLEVTMNTPDVISIIRELRDQFPRLNIGAGTVCSHEDLEKAVLAGAQFIVTPILNKVVIKEAVNMKIPIFPGAFTPTEIFEAWNLGASAVKVFPSTQLGVQYIKDVLAPLDKIKLIPTGGVNLQNIQEFFKAGAIAVGMGSSLFPKEIILRKDYEELNLHLIQLKEKIDIALHGFETEVNQ